MARTSDEFPTTSLARRFAFRVEAAASAFSRLTRLCMSLTLATRSFTSRRRAWTSFAAGARVHLEMLRNRAKCLQRGLRHRYSKKVVTLATSQVQYSSSSQSAISVKFRFFPHPRAQPAITVGHHRAHVALLRRRAVQLVAGRRHLPDFSTTAAAMSQAEEVRCKCTCGGRL